MRKEYFLVIKIKNLNINMFQKLNMGSNFSDNKKKLLEKKSNYTKTEFNQEDYKIELGEVYIEFFNFFLNKEISICEISNNIQSSNIWSYVFHKCDITLFFTCKENMNNEKIKRKESFKSIIDVGDENEVFYIDRLRNNMVSDITENKFSIIIDDEDNLDNRIIIKTFLEFRNNLEDIFVYVMKNNNYLNSNINSKCENKLFSLLKKEDINNYDIHIRGEYVIVTSKNFF